MDNQQSLEHYMTAKGAILSNDRFSMREISYRLFFRFRLFLFCTLVIPVCALLMIHVIPPTYSATSKIMIKHNDSITPFFDEIATSRKQIISGQSNVEIIKSLPICERVVQKLGLESSDMAKPAIKILIFYVAKFYYFFKAYDENDEQAPPGEGDRREFISLAKELKDTITPRIIQKGRNTLLAEDELIEVEVRSFNRERVAEITNTVCAEFIEEFYSIYEKEATQAYEYLSKQITVTKKQIIKDTKPGGMLSGEEWSERNINSNPIVSRIARQVAELETELFRLKNVYASDSPEVIKAQAAFDDAVRRLENYKATESAETILNVLAEKRRTAYMTLQLYKNRLIPISIMEEAVTPKKSSLLLAGRYAIVGIIGLIAGILTGFILVMFFSAIDNRLYTPWDIERNTNLEIIGSIRESDEINEHADTPGNMPSRSMSNAIMDMLGMLDLMSTERGRILLITSPVQNEGKTTIAIQAAMALSKDKRARTLLIDANFNHPDLTKKFEHLHSFPEDEMTDEKQTANNIKGLVDVLVGDASIRDVIRPYKNENFDIIFSGTGQRRKQVGFYKKSLRTAFETVKNDYDLVIIDSPGLLSSVDAALFASEADSTVLITRAGSTRIETIKNAIAVLERMNIEPVGTILNFRNFPVPKLFYG